eukprot:TRINITY_DN3353_c0_g1_i1.p1 TRINITY_DN3353_c0_g1~~TRINITY_DN3353_c0_g1_i1.p1  ORF type:complete len:440 (-),score=94.90 TRINITY_DN3353_c0_g1_i1:83-1402(-)
MSSSVECPVCRKITRQSVKTLEKNRYAANLVEKLKNAQKRTSTPPVQHNSFESNKRPRNQSNPTISNTELLAGSLYPEFSNYLQLNVPHQGPIAPSAPPMDNSIPVPPFQEQHQEQHQEPLYPIVFENLPPQNPFMEESPRNNRNEISEKKPEKMPEPEIPANIRKIRTDEKEEKGFFNSLIDFFVGPSQIKENVIQPTQEIIPRFAPFETTPEKAKKIFDNYMGSLWFPPSDLMQKFSVANLQQVYVPFWMFSVNAAVGYSGLVCHYDDDGSKKKVERWNQASGSHSSSHDGVMILADMSQNNLVLENITSLSNWNVHKATLHGPSVPSAQVDKHTSYPTAWERCSRIIQRKEETLCAQKLVKEEKAIRIQEFRLNSIDFSIRSQDLVYLPVYVSSYSYGQTEYRFVISGQTGEIISQRPYGLGKLGSTIGTLMGYRK